MEMQDMGYKPKKSEVPTAVSSEEPKIQYPRVYIDRKVPQELMNKAVGSICRLEIVGKIVNKSISDTTEGEQEQRCEIEIHKLGYIGKAGQFTKEEKLSMPLEEREKADKEEVMSQEEDKETEE